MERIKVAIISESAGNWPVYVGLEKGNFEKLNLEVDVDITRSSVKQMDALKSGGVYDIGHQSSDHIVRAAEQGSDLFIFMGLTTPNYSLIVTPDIQGYDDLKGKVLGVDGLNTGFALLLQGLLKKNGLILEQDYQLTQVGGTGERLNAVLEGKVAGVFLDGPADLVAESKGLRRLGSNLDYLPDYQGTVAATRREWVNNNTNKDKLLNYIRGYVEASRWLHQQQNRGEAVDILARYISIEENIGLKTYDRYIDMKTFNYDGEINKDGLAEVINVMLSTGQLSEKTLVNKYIDTNYLQLAK